ncbi:MAG: hypothetical protein PUP92_29630 [Rhizonema sp. PD38]|nr:hypothetical protein [Rhizonema sp. PD38]
MGNIRVIGPRGSGKTTYLAALAYWPDKRRTGKQAHHFTIQALNDETRELADKAENIIREGGSLEPTTVAGGIDSLPFYSFQIDIKSFLSTQNKINLAVRDYPGEIFEELELGKNNSLQNEFIDECLMKDVKGCLILLTEWKKGTDKFYSRVIKRFTALMDAHDRSHDLRIAVAMSKCERGELWPGRLYPEIDLFDVHLPETKATLQAKISPKNLRFYAISTFGVLQRNDPRPNRVDEWGTDGRNSVLRKPSAWRPYGMISPLYWLSTGQRMRDDA